MRAGFDALQLHRCAAAVRSRMRRPKDPVRSCPATRRWRRRRRRPTNRPSIHRRSIPTRCRRNRRRTRRPRCRSFRARPARVAGRAHHAAPAPRDGNTQQEYQREPKCFQYARMLLPSSNPPSTYTPIPAYPDSASSTMHWLGNAGSMRMVIRGCAWHTSARRAA